MKKTTPHAAPRRDRIVQEVVHDPYKRQRKLQSPCVCPDCGAVFDAGRWRWGTAPDDAPRERCQACHRIADDYPAGEVSIEGAFARAHQDEIVNLARNQEELEKGEHPLNRIIKIGNSPGGIVVTTTDIHLPRRIGDALHNAYKGELEFHYDEGSYFIRVGWRRDA